MVGPAPGLGASRYSGRVPRLRSVSSLLRFLPVAALAYAPGAAVASDLRAWSEATLTALGSDPRAPGGARFDRSRIREAFARIPEACPELGTEVEALSSLLPQAERERIPEDSRRTFEDLMAWAAAFVHGNPVGTGAPSACPRIPPPLPRLAEARERFAGMQKASSVTLPASVVCLVAMFDWDPVPELAVPALVARYRDRLPDNPEVRAALRDDLTTLLRTARRRPEAAPLPTVAPLRDEVPGSPAPHRPPWARLAAGALAALGVAGLWAVRRRGPGHGSRPSPEDPSLPRSPALSPAARATPAPGPEAPAPGNPASAATASSPTASPTQGMFTVEALAARIPERYRGPRLLGKGGMGLVFAAEDTALSRPVAVKLLSPLLVGEDLARERFVREARTLAGISHPNIVRVHDVASEPWPILTMELLEGETLGARLERGPLATDEFFAMALGLTAALAHCHDKGLLHRDVKPENLFLCRDGTTRLADFGLALDTADERLTRTGALLGSPLFMAPEQLMGLSADVRSEVYSTGLTLFEALAGRLPFERREYHKKLEGFPVRPEDLGPGRGELLAPVLARALAARPEQRYASIAELAEALAAARRALAQAADRPAELLSALESLRAETFHSLSSKLAVAKTFAGKPERFAAAFLTPEALADVLRLLSGPDGALARMERLRDLASACRDHAGLEPVREAVASLDSGKEALRQLAGNFHRLWSGLSEGRPPPDPAALQARLVDLAGRFRSWNESLRTRLAPFRIDPCERLEARARSFAARGLSLSVEGIRPPPVFHPDGPALCADLGTVFDVLLENASQAGAGRIRAVPDPSRGTLVLEDDGRGLPPGDPERLFAEGVTTREDGTGTGLPLARRLLRARGGDLTLEPAATGARARLRLPQTGYGTDPGGSS